MCISLPFPRQSPLFLPCNGVIVRQQIHANQSLRSVAAAELPASQPSHFGGCSAASRTTIRRLFVTTHTL
jgi:hypothetical protein